MKFFAFIEKYGKQSTIVEEMRSLGLLRTSMNCEVCGNIMIERKKNNSDGISYACKRRTCRCEKTIRADSFFENSRLTLCECMLFLHLWSKNYPEKLICEEFTFSNKTVIDWSRYCRELCVHHFEADNALIGGIGCTVEIDETIIVKRKNNQGRVLSDGWLFGGIERREDGVFRCFLTVVYNRSAPHLIHHITQHVAQGTHIITDGWPAYSRLNEYGYTHSIVIHEENFISPDDPTIHTQLIESTWCSLKRFIRSRGTHKGPHLLEYICEYVFRRKHSDVFGALIDVITNKYEF